jgi:LPS export ABC transporter protein LptC
MAHRKLQYFFPFQVKQWARFAMEWALILFFSSCQTDIPTVSQIIAGKNHPSETGKSVEIIYSDSGRVKMKLTAAQLDRYVGEKPYIEMPKGVKMFFFDDSFKITSQLKADYAIRYDNEGKMEAKRHVVVVNVKGDTLNTEHLIWDENKERVYTNAFVRITTADEIIYGDGLESNEDFTKYKITHIKGMFNVKDKDTPVAQ